MSTPTTRTLKHLRDDGWLAGVVEYWQPSFASRSVVDAATAAVPNARKIREAVANYRKFGPGKRQDLFDFVDIVAVGLGRPRFVQCTSASGLSARVDKIVIDCQESAIACLKSRVRIEVWGWRKYAKAENRKYWRPKIKLVTLRGKSLVVEDYTPTTPRQLSAT